MDQQVVIVFSFPRKALLEMSLGEKMGVVQEILKDIPDMQILSVEGETANTIMKSVSLRDEEESNLVLHARRELALVGNDEEFNTSIINAVKAFASYGHSGGSASIAVPLLNDLLQYKNLSPLTDKSDEWMQVEMGDENCWQSTRNSEAFSKDGGKTYYLLSEGGSSQNPRPIHDSKRMYA